MTGDGRKRVGMARVGSLSVLPPRLRVYLDGDANIILLYEINMHNLKFRKKYAKLEA